MIQKFKNYSFQELVELSSQSKESAMLINHILYSKEFKKITKPIIKTYQDFDENTRVVYSKIAQSIRELNPNQPDLYVVASGSRVNGKWRSDEETEQICENFNIKKIKYSDYDFISNCEFIPDLIQLASTLKVRYINKIGSYNKNQEIEIPIN
jgi:hypothetical protein